MSFLYTLLLKLLYPTSLCLVLLGGAVVFRKRKTLCRACFALAVGVLLICGNGWLVRGLTKHLEWQYLPLTMHPADVSLPQVSGLIPHPSFEADAILVLSGGILPPIPPRPTVEVADAGDRLLYGAYLFRKGSAPRIICTGNVGTGGLASRPAAADMAEFLEMLGIPKDAIITELKAEDTHQHGVYLGPLLREKGFKRVLLVTSAMHMPRSVGVFRHLCPSIEFVPAPTDFRTVELLPMPWYRHLVALIPTPRSLLDFSDVMHEYLGMAYYKVRGWI
jgi:uncharacterized SAM-binding protein YcdF (DUF218 family)